VQVEGPLSFAFETRLESPIPELTDEEIRELAIKIVEPVWPANSVKPGDVIEVDVSVNEQGQLTGTGYSKVPIAVQGVVMNAIRQWTFRPLIRNGKPEYFHGFVKFVVR